MTLQKFGRYEIIEELGQGGMAEVYAAKDPRMERLVALKIIRKNFSENEKFQERFLNEAKMIAGLEHRAILPVHDFGQDEKTQKLYLVMRLMPDVLHKRLEKNGAISLEDTSLILNRLAAALHTAHSRGIVHRDIKPPNILLDEEGTVFLADFGLAEPVDKIEAGFVPQSYGGSPFYMAPEQWRGERVSPYTDIYQLGVTLFEMLTGERPFPEENLELLLDRHVNGHIPQARDLNPRLPKTIQPILEKAMAKNPLDRYKSCRELAEEVANLLHPKQIKNRYEIKEELQHGRLATVCLAHDLFEQREVALKIMKHELIPYASFQQQFQQQRQQLMNLPENTAIVPIYDVDQHEGQPYIAMQFVDGASLRDRMRKERVFSLETVYKLGSCLAQTLDSLHAANLAHGDVNLGNVLLDEAEKCYLTDFHITAVAELTKAVLVQQNPLGYMPYMAPEQWRGEAITPQTDVYQFGVMIFEMLTGQPPFTGASAEELRQAVENDPPPKITAVKPELPPQFDTILARALAKKPEARFAKASEVINRLIQAGETHVFDTLKKQGDAHYKKRQWEAAIEAYLQAQQLKPESSTIRDALERARKRKHDSSIIYQSDLAIEAKRWQEAEDFLERATDSPEKKEKLAFVRRMIQVETKYQAGKSAIQDGQWFAAQKLLDEADFLAPNYEDVNRLLGEVAEKMEILFQQARTAVNQEKYDDAPMLLESLDEHETAVTLHQEIAEKQQPDPVPAPSLDESQTHRRPFGWWIIGLFGVAIAALFILNGRLTDEEKLNCVQTAVPELHISRQGEAEQVLQPRGTAKILGDWEELALSVEWGPDDFPVACQRFLNDDNSIESIWQSNAGEIQRSTRWEVSYFSSSSSLDNDRIVVTLLFDGQPLTNVFLLHFQP